MAEAKERFHKSAGDLINGHSPGAISLPFRELLNTDGLFKSETRLSTLFDAIIPNYSFHEIYRNRGSGYAALDHAGVTSTAGKLQVI